MLLDGLIILGAAVLALAVMLALTSSTAKQSDTWMLTWVLFMGFSISLGPLYFGLQESGRSRATLGKRLFCIQVTRPTQLPLGFWRAIARNLLHVLSAVLLLGYLIQPFTRRRQALHDLLTDTVVTLTPGNAVRRLIAAFLYLLASVLTLILAALLAWTAINAGDDALKPEVAQAMVWKPPTNALDDNGYLVLLGKDAQAGTDPYDAGRLILQQQLLLHAQLAPHAPWASEPTRSPSSEPAGRCDYQKQHCVTHYLAERPATEQLLAAAEPDAQKFLAMARAANFIEVEVPRQDAPRPPLRFLNDAAELIRIRALYNIADGKPNLGVNQLIECAQFSRRLVRSTSTVVGRMVAVGMVHRDMRLLSELLGQYPALAQTHGEQLSPLTAPLAGEAFSMHPPFAFETTFSLNVLPGRADATREAWWRRLAVRLFYLPNATLNAFYAQAQVQTNWIDAQIRAGRLQDIPIPMPEPGPNLFGLVYLRNPIGELLVDTGWVNYLPYFQRQVDADGHARLVGLQLMLMRQRIPHDKMGDTVQAATPAMRDPYSGAAMQWDVKASQIRFQGRQPSNHNYGKSSLIAVTIP